MDFIRLVNAFPGGEPAQKGFFLYSKVPPALLKKIEEDNFRKTVRFVYNHSRFYKRRFDELGIRVERVRTPEDLGDFFTTPEDLRAFNEEFVCLPPDTAYETTGTTSRKTKRVYFSRNEVREAGWAGAVGLWGLGVRRQDRVASAFDYSFWVSGPVLAASCDTLGAFHVEAGRMDPAEFYERLSDYGLTVIVGDPSWLVRLTEVAEKRGAWKLKLLLAGGENMTEATRSYIERVWKADLILSYGQTEGFGALGIESLGKDGYHLNEFHNRFEIINRDAQGYGEIVYTTLNRRVMPLVRYRSGDITRFLEGPSKSGLPGRRVEKLKGRIDEWTVTSAGNVAPWMFEPVFSDEGDWQLVVQKDNNKDALIFNVESTNGGETLKTRVLDKLSREWPEIARIRDMGYVTLDVKAVEKGSLRSGRKLRRIVDLRRF